VSFSEFKPTFLAATAVGISVAMPAFAQTTASATDAGLSEIIVTARRIDERLQDVPISIQVFNQRQLQQQNVVNSQDLAAFTPSLSANTNFGSENSSFAIRGFVQDIGTAPSVGTYFGDVVAPRGASNGLPTGDGAGPGSFFDLQNVQVLKGPQGTLFGRNTTGGAVLLVPQKPTGDLDGYVEGSVGDFDLRGVQAVLNLPINDKLRIRLGVDHQSRDGYAINTSGIGPRDFDDVNYTAVRASIVADLTPDLENYTIGSFSYSNTHGSVQKLFTAARSGLGNFAVAQLAAQAANHDGFYDLRQDLTDPYSKLKQWQIINTTTWNATDTLTVKNIASYAQIEDTLQSALFGTNFASPAIAALGLPSFNFGFASIVPAPGAPTAHESTTTEEFRLEGRTTDGRLTWQTGAYFEISQPLGVAGSQSPVAISCTNSSALQCTDILQYLGVLAGGPARPAGAVNLTTGETRYRDAAAYAQSTYKLTDQFKLTGGLRFTSDEETNDNLQRTYVFTSPAPFALPTVPFAVCTNVLTNANGCRSHYSESSHAPTWLIDLDYTPTNDILAYAKYARGYRSGVIAPNVTAPYNYVQPEKVDAYEIGMKSSFASAVRGTFNVAGFYNDFSNQQLELGFDAAPGSPASPTSAPVNAGKSRIYGVEVNTTITPFESFQLEGDYTYLNTRIQQIKTFPTPVGSLYVVDGQQKVGDPLALSPKNKYRLTGTYTLPLGDNIGKISVGASFIHTDSMVVNYGDRDSHFPAIAAAGILPPTDLVNLSLDWNSIVGKPVDLMLFATNVTNKAYYTFIPGIGLSTGFETAQLGLPRMYGLRLRVRFGN
jgi:iron complex outermembrane receptor protein